MGAGPGCRPLVHPRARRTAPSGRAPDRGRPAQCPVRAGHVRSQGPQRGSAKVGLQFCRWEVGGPNTRTGWRMTGGRWRGGGVERKTPGLNRGIKKGGRKGKARLRSWACWKGAFACGAKGTESPRWPRPRAREISPEKAEQGQRATLQGRARAAPAC